MHKILSNLKGFKDFKFDCEFSDVSFDKGYIRIYGNRMGDGIGLGDYMYHLHSYGRNCGDFCINYDDFNYPKRFFCFKQDDA